MKRTLEFDTRNASNFFSLLTLLSVMRIEEVTKGVSMARSCSLGEEDVGDDWLQNYIRQLGDVLSDQEVAFLFELGYRYSTRRPIELAEIFMLHPEAVNCFPEGDPIREEYRKVAEKAFEPEFGKRIQAQKEMFEHWGV